MSAAKINHEVSSTDPEVIAMDSTKHKNEKKPSTLTRTTEAGTKVMSNGKYAQDQPLIPESIEVAQSKRKKRCTQSVSNREILSYLQQLNRDPLFKMELIGSCGTGAIDV